MILMNIPTRKVSGCRTIKLEGYSITFFIGFELFAFETYEKY